jgi:tRNA threonylcarbamoyladenosine biosynthesis protein TsaB
MNILALDTSTWALAVAISRQGTLLGEVNSYIPKNHAARLMPAIDYLLASLDLTTKDLDLIAVGSGPGSYTGVRIGVTVAKTLAWTLNLPLLGLSSLQAIAQNRAEFEGLIVPFCDARRGNVYAGLYRGRVKPNESDRSLAENHGKEKKEMAPRSGVWWTKPVAPDRIQPLSQLLDEVEQEDGMILFIGPGVGVHGEKVKERLGEKAVFADEAECCMTGRALADLAWQYRANHTRDVHPFVPRYLQLAEAEKKWLEKQR